MALRVLNAQTDRGNAVDCVSITYRNGKISGSRALAIGEEMIPVLKTRRSLAVLQATLLFARDGGEDMRVDGVWCGLDKGFDVYRFDLPIPSVAGLYFYGYELHTASGKWYMRAGGTIGYDKVYIGRMLIYDEKYKAPSWMDGGIIYHIFVDRFFKGSKEVPVRDDAVMLTDWDNGVPEYAERQGDFLPNNTFFGGTLWGVAEKLDYLKELGVTCIYLSPVFKAYSNHKYDTGDYMQVDEMFGGDEALKNLFDEAAKRGIGVILDGVFNHVGDNSLYFDKYGNYGGNGAYSGGASSPYYSWFNFKEFPDNYQSWWGIGNLPRVNRNASFRQLINGKGGVVDKYMSMGASGFRLDVVDELETDFVTELCAAIKSKKDDAYIVGEVWEDASDKMAYGERKKYFQGAQLDSVMNYPLRSAIVEYVLHGSARFLADTIDTLYRHYPLHKTSYLMNILGTHDTERILTIMGGERSDGYSNAELAEKKMDTLHRIVARHRLMTAVLLQMTLPGIPCIYYGDEAGMEGYRDPFNRRPYPWDREDKEIFGWYKKLISLRKDKVFTSTAYRLLKAQGGLFAFERGENVNRIVVCTNTGGDTARLELDGAYTSMLTGQQYDGFIDVQPGMGEVLKVKC